MYLYFILFSKKPLLLIRLIAWIEWIKQFGYIISAILEGSEDFPKWIQFVFG